MPRMEELSILKSAAATRDQTNSLMASKDDLDYAYGQLELVRETSRHYVFVIRGKKFNSYYRFKKSFYGQANISTMFQEEME